MSSDDVRRFLSLDQSYVAICCQDGEPLGYVVFCLRLMEEQTPELFILQALGEGGRAWVDEAWEHIHELALKMGCHRIGTMLPTRQAPRIARRFHLFPEGVYATAVVRGKGMH